MEDEDVLGDYIESKSSKTPSSFSSRTSSSSSRSTHSNSGGKYWNNNRSTKKPMCEYGAKCYRKNPEHLRDYDHSGPGRGKSAWGNPSGYQGRGKLGRSNSSGDIGNSSGYHGGSTFSAGKAPDINPCRNWVQGFCRNTNLSKDCKLDHPKFDAPVKHAKHSLEKETDKKVIEQIKKEFKNEKSKFVGAQRITNDVLKALFLLRQRDIKVKRSVTNERQLFYGVHEEVLEMIMSKGVIIPSDRKADSSCDMSKKVAGDDRPSLCDSSCKKCTSKIYKKQYLGNGAYFSVSPDKALERVLTKDGKKPSRGDKCYLLWCKVELGKTDHNKSDGDLPHRSFDSNGNDATYVIFHKFQALPTHLIECKFP